jgi:hypothetical protein
VSSEPKSVRWAIDTTICSRKGWSNFIGDERVKFFQLGAQG